MPRLLLPNLMFEDELDGTAHRVPALARKSAAQLAPLMGLLTSSTSTSASEGKDTVVVNEDAVPSEIPPALQHLRFETFSSLTKTNLPENYLQGVEYQPWGWSEAAIRWGQRLGLHFSSPDPHVVKLINSRKFLAPYDGCFPFRIEAEPNADYQIEVEAGGLPGGRLCWSAHEVSDALQEFAALGFSNWVIKSNLSQAARNRVCGDGARIPATTQNWLLKRFVDEQPVYVEPWFERVAECGLQFHVPPSTSQDSIEFVGSCEMLTDRSGRYRGSIVSTVAGRRWSQPAILQCKKIAAAARQRGFFGPLGMDCMLIRHGVDGGLWLRPCHDINGRFTMGRVALSLRHWLRPGEFGFWCHGVAKTGGTGRNLFDHPAGEDVRIIPTSPALYGLERTTFLTALLISADCGRLTTVVSEILSQNIRGPFDQMNVSDLSTAANEKSPP